MGIEKTFFGTTKSGEKVYKFSLTNNKNIKIEIINYGATIISFNIKDKSGNIRDIVLGYDNIDDYEKGEKYFGATIGRNSNRIEGSQFKLKGETYKLNPNEGENQLHGGDTGFQKRVWNYEVKDDSMVFTYISKDGEEGYPGECTLEVEFILNDEDELHINYTGNTDKDTILNPTNHSYFNLNGHDKGTILNHFLQVDAASFLPTREDNIPTGEKIEVKNTSFDLNTPKKVGDIVKTDHPQIKKAKGLDHNFCLDNNNILKLVATLFNDDKTIKLLTYTDLPGIQIYTGNFIGDEKGKDGTIYSDHSGVCLETQYYPNSINEKKFESSILRAEDTFKSTTVYKIIY